MKKLLAFIFLTSLVVYAGLPPTTLKGGNEASLQTTFQFDLGQIPVTRTGSNVVFGTIPVTQGGTSSTSLTQYSLMSGNGTSAVNMIAPGASGTILFSQGASAFPSYRLLASSDITTSLGYTPLASTTAAIVSTLGYTPLNRANNLSDLASSATARTNLGLGSLATKSVINLGSADVTGTTSVVNGGTGLSSITDQGILVGSGTTSYRIASPASAGAVLMQSVSGTTAFLQPQPINVGNLLINGGFETYDSGTGSFYGWSSSSSGDIGNWTSPSQWDLKYWRHIDTSVTLGTDIFQTVTIPSSLYGQNCEFGFDYTNTNTSGTVTRSWYVSGTSTVSGTFSSSGTSSIKAFLPCGTASDTTKVVNITTTNASASGVTSVDNVYFGPAKSLVNGAIVGPWQSLPSVAAGTLITATTTNPTFGTIATNIARARRIGSNLELEWDFRQTSNGTAGSGTYLFNIPAALNCQIDTVAKPANTGLDPSNATDTDSVVGKFSFGNGATTGEGSVVVYSTTQLKADMIYSGSSTNRNSWSSGAATNFGNTGWISIRASIPCAGQQGSGVTYESRCPNDISCANTFSAKVSGTTVTSENLDWISSVGLTDTSLYTITFNSGVFTDAPNCVANASRVGIPSTTMSIESVTSSSVAVRGRGDTGALQATDFFVQCNKSTDYVAKKTITGYLSNTVNHDAPYIMKMYSAHVTNTNGSQAINSKSSNWINTSSCAGTGQCTYAITAGTFTSSSTYWCADGAIGSTGGTSTTHIKNSSTSLSITTYNGTTPANMQAEIICWGY